MKERWTPSVLRFAGDVALGHDREPVCQREPHGVADDLQGRDAVLGRDLLAGGKNAQEQIPVLCIIWGYGPRACADRPFASRPGTRYHAFTAPIGGFPELSKGGA